MENFEKDLWNFGKNITENYREKLNKFWRNFSGIFQGNSHNIWVFEKYFVKFVNIFYINFEEILEI